MTDLLTGQTILFDAEPRVRPTRYIPTWADFKGKTRRVCDDCVTERHNSDNPARFRVRDVRRRHVPTNRHYCYSHAIDRGDERA
jgi:hypothetical protein